MPDTILTNNKPNTIHTIVKDTITFETLLNNYPEQTIKHDKDHNGTDFKDHCAIHLSEALLRSGVMLKGFPTKRKCWGCPTPDEHGKGVHAIAATDLANYLLRKPFVGCPKAVNINPSNLYDDISDKKGIIYFENYWQRDGDSNDNRTGDHIDLWDGFEFVSNGIVSTLSRRIFPSISEWAGLSDLSKSSKILLWKFLIIFMNKSYSFFSCNFIISYFLGCVICRSSNSKFY